jgi:hypothetical protein
MILSQDGHLDNQPTHMQIGGDAHSQKKKLIISWFSNSPFAT